VLSVSVRFYGELNDFLPAAHRQATLVCGLENSSSVKDLVEALGVPHPEIELLVVNGRTVDFACRVRDGDRVAAYPPFQTLDLDADARLGPPAQIEPRFVADVHLGRLAAYLRLAGLDTVYRNDYRDDEIVAASASEDRTLLTRDVGVLKHRMVTRGYFVRETRPARQLVEVLRRFDLAWGSAPDPGSVASGDPCAPRRSLAGAPCAPRPTRPVPFTRCLRCNGRLQPVPKDEVEHLLPPRTREHYRDFSRCPACARIYWQGSHYAQMKLFLDKAFAVAAGGRGGRG
jgi:uncharacterized protein